MQKATVIPAMKYKDPKTAIDFLCKAFGFESKLVVPDDENNIKHAELTHGTGMIMLGGEHKHQGTKASAFDSWIKHPANVGGETQSCYIIVSDVDAHYKLAKAAGAKILLELDDKPYGRDYTCSDLEGHIWTFGSYDPWKG